MTLADQRFDWLRRWENHEHQTEHDNSLTLKVFALNFFVAYGSLILTSYIYVRPLRRQRNARPS